MPPVRACSAIAALALVALSAGFGAGCDGDQPELGACETDADCDGVFSVQCPPGSTTNATRCEEGRCMPSCRADPSAATAPSGGSR